MNDDENTNDLRVEIFVDIPMEFFGEHVTSDELQNLDYSQIEAAVVAGLMERLGRLTEDAQRLFLEWIMIEDWSPAAGWLDMYDDEQQMDDKFGSARSDPNSAESRSAIGEVCSQCGINPADALVDGDPMCSACLVSAVDAEYEVIEGEVVDKHDEMCKYCNVIPRAAGYAACPGCFLQGFTDESVNDCDHGVPYHKHCTDCARMDAELYQSTPSRTNPQDSKYYCVHGKALAEVCSQCNIYNQGKGRTFMKGSKPLCAHGADVCRACNFPPTTSPVRINPPAEDKPTAPLLELNGVPIMRKRKVKA